MIRTALVLAGSTLATAAALVAAVGVFAGDVSFAGALGVAAMLVLGVAAWREFIPGEAADDAADAGLAPSPAAWEPTSGRRNVTTWASRVDASAASVEHFTRVIQPVLFQSACAAARERRGVDLQRDPGAGEQLFGPTAWPLVSGPASRPPSIEQIDAASAAVLSLYSERVN